MRAADLGQYRTLTGEIEAVNAKLGAAVSHVAARRLGGRALTLPNAVTLTRASAAAMLCGMAFSGRGRRVGLWSLLLGSAVVDWLDGLLARRERCDRRATGRPRSVPCLRGQPPGPPTPRGR